MKLTCLAIVGKRSDQLLYIRDFPLSASSNVDVPAISNDYREILGLLSGSNNTTTIEVSPWDKCSLQHQFLLAEAAERLEDIIRSPQQYLINPISKSGTNDKNDIMWVGLVYIAHDQTVYGYVTSTKIKILAAVQDSLLDIDNKQKLKANENMLKGLFVENGQNNVHQSYVDYLMNPFSSKTDKIVSNRFDSLVKKYVEAYNSTSTPSI